jgi:hypothetical protein
MARDDPHQACFSGSVSTQQADPLTGGNIQVDAIQQRLRTHAQTDITQGNQRHGFSEPSTLITR